MVGIEWGRPRRPGARGLGPRAGAVRAGALLLLAALAGGVALARADLAARAPCTAADRCRAEWVLRNGGRIGYYRSLPLEVSEAVRSAVIVIHGNGRDADRYFERLVAAAAADERLADALLLAPGFRTLKDRPGAGELFWSSHGWKIGNKSLDPLRLGSFEVIDELLARVCPASRRLFPGLRRVVLVGHSAGAQFVNRYAAGGRGCPDSAMPVRYVVLNPSSYLYVDGRRWIESAGRFGVPESRCSDYDDYKYGLRDPNGYMRRVGVARIRENLFTRTTFYLAGEQDRKTGGSLDRSCAGNLQGPHRLARHANYRRYSELFEDWEGSEFATVPGIGHHGGRMLRSPEVRRILFR